MNIALFLKKAASVVGERPAVALGTKTFATFKALEVHVAALARHMKERVGLVSGDRVVLLMSNVPEYIEVLFACWWGGFIAVPVNAKLNPHEIKFIFNNAEPKLCFTTPNLAANILYDTNVIITNSKEYKTARSGYGTKIADLSPDQLAWLFYTSGTTGKPKGAMLSHRNLLTMSACYFMDIEQILPGECILHAAPMSHGSGLYAIPHMAARSIQLIPESGTFNPDELFELFQKCKRISLFGAPTMVRRLVAHKAAARGPGNLKSIIYGGGPMYINDCKLAMNLLGNRLIQIYGQGESPMTITALSKAHHSDKKHPNYDKHLASVGIPQSLVDVRIMKNHNFVYEAGKIGEILVRGDTVMRGYWRNPEATKKKIINGWLHTGDIGFIDKDGFVTLIDRTTDLIISGGLNIYPREIEEQLIMHPGVDECAIVGKPDAEWGEIVTAFIVTTPNHHISADDLDKLCINRLARFKRPRVYKFVKTLPKNNYGKILKKDLKKFI
ncbi:MAG: Long-chain-fatty-acid--CoA ligase [Alphaproteobacteria bacterium MarineAlpha3_Bin5]|nr:AMP-dependent synthetase [Magnetovibrio sp.]PPR78622.1 MAG: Long-chain-fatty-acid--CoA ligase [Alphaproteobacteria bacterium MarineAlpha3_Bin5]